MARMAAIPNRISATLIFTSIETLGFMVKSSVRGHGTVRFRVSRRAERISRRFPIYGPPLAKRLASGGPHVPPVVRDTWSV